MLAAQIKAKEEVGVGAASGDDDEDGDSAGKAGSKRGRAARQRGGFKRDGDGEDDSGDEDAADDLAPDADLLAELKGELDDEEPGDDRGGGGGGAHAPVGMSYLASHDVQIGNHGAYIEPEVYEEQVGRAEGERARCFALEPFRPCLNPTGDGRGARANGP